MTERQCYLWLIVGAMGFGLFNPLGDFPTGWASPINAPNARALYPPLAWASPHETKEIATKKADGLEVTLLAGPPMSPEEMAKRMPGMMTMPGMEPMPGMKPTHWLGVIITDARTGNVLKDLQVELTAKRRDDVRRRQLIAMPGSYANNISLLAVGAYKVLIKIADPSFKQPLEVPFDFEYR